LSIDRDATLKQAEKLLRQGKLDGAIAEYVRLVEDQPQDWNSINALGDLYVRAGKNDRAIEQFIRIADHQFSEGFFPKSAALYKKALKLQPDQEHILMQLASIGERQGKFVDAKQYLRQVARQREARGERRAAAECILRLGSLPESDVESKIAAAHAAQQIGDGFRAVELLKEAAHVLEKEKKRNEAMQLLAEAAEIDPFDAELRIRLAREFLAAGQPKQARVYLSFETAGDDVELLLALATVEFADGHEDDARVAMARVLALAPDREPDIAKLADELMAKGRIDSAFACMDAITDAALLRGDVPAAAAALQKFVVHTPHEAAVTKLLGIAEDLVRGDPANDAHADLLLQALTARGTPNAERIVTRVRTGQPAEEPEPEPEPQPTPAPTDDLDLTSGVPDLQVSEELPEFDIFAYPEKDTPSVTDLSAADIPIEPTAAEVAIPDPPITGDDDTAMLEMAEIDLSTALSGLISPGPVLPPAFAESGREAARQAAPLGQTAERSVPAGKPRTIDGSMDAPAPAEPSPGAQAAPEPIAAEAPAADIEDIFAQMRAKSAREQQASAALQQYEQAMQFIEQGLDKEAIAALEAAARVPMLRFKAAARLGRLLIDRGDLNEGVEWLERAAEAPAPSPDEGYDLLYELAGALEAQGESARALAILMELDAEAEGYRDVRTRIMYLSRAQQTESHRS
jgi:tetratricopeptide (TPR) repeat protein